VLECLGYRPVNIRLGDDLCERYETLKPQALLLNVSQLREKEMDCARKLLESDPDANIVLLADGDKNSYAPLDNKISGLVKGTLTSPLDVAELSRILAEVTD
jgi:DNA-binding NarL/FixJ family response regulator